jgi:hypothetical protein
MLTRAINCKILGDFLTKIYFINKKASINN